jgi:murein tripeptide amidase MpaA
VIKDIVDKHRIFIVPVVNPDGYEMALGPPSATGARTLAKCPS